MVQSTCSITLGDCHGTCALHAPSTSIAQSRSNHARATPRTPNNPYTKQKLCSSCATCIPPCTMAQTSARVMPWRRLLSRVPATSGTREVSRGEVSTWEKFEQADMCACGRLLGCRVHQKVQKAGHARARQRICGRLQMLARGAWPGLEFEGPDRTRSFRPRPRT